MLFGLALLLTLGAQTADEIAPSTTSGASSAEPVADPSVSILVLNIQPGGIDVNTARTLGDLIAVALGEIKGAEVASGSDLKRALEFEQEKAALGCDEESCLAEIAGALGADLIVFGSGAVLGDKQLIYLSLFDANVGKTINRVTIEFEEAGELLRVLRPALFDLVSGELRRRGLNPAFAAPRTRVAEEESSSGPGWVMLGFGGPAVLLGVVSYLGMAVVGWSVWIMGGLIIMGNEVDYRAATTAADRREHVETAIGNQEALGSFALVWGLASLLPVALVLTGVGLLGGGTWWLMSGEGDE